MLVPVSQGCLGRCGRQTPLLCLIAWLGLAACGGPHGTQRFDWHTSEGDSNYVYQPQGGTFDSHRVLEDEELEDWKALTAAEIQYFLANNPYGGRSVLADYSEGGVSAAVMLQAAAEAHGINPLVMWVRLQLEQSLVAKTSAPLSTLRWAMGCGCPDGSACNPSYRGFGKQIQCMASSLRAYLGDMDTSNSSISGWGVGVDKLTLDGYTVRPSNAATAALYSYAPWREAAKKHWSIWVHYARYARYKPPSAPSTAPVDAAGEIVVDDDNSHNQGPHYFKASVDWAAASQSQALHGGARIRGMASASGSARYVICLQADRVVYVSACWTAGSNRTAQAPYTVFDAQNNDLGTVYVDQRGRGGQWVLLGSFPFSAGCNVVRLSRWGGAGTVVVADAIRVD